MTKPANLVKTILHGAIGLLGVLILGFLGLPYISALGETKNAYDILDFSTPNPTTKQTFACVVVLLLVIFACLMIVASVLALLGDFGVVSNEVYAKVVKWVLFASVLAVLVLTILNIVACTGVVAETNETIDQLNQYYASLGQPVVLPKATSGIAGMVLNILCGAGATACVSYSTFKKD